MYVHCVIVTPHNYTVSCTYIQYIVSKPLIASAGVYTQIHRVGQFRMWGVSNDSSGETNLKLGGLYIAYIVMMKLSLN